MVECWPLSEIQAGLLKVAHHGSETSSSEAFIDAVAPWIAVVSSAVTAHYKLPDKTGVQRYKRRGVQVFWTNRGTAEEDFSAPRFEDDHIVCASTGASRGVSCGYRSR